MDDLAQQLADKYNELSTLKREIAERFRKLRDDIKELANLEDKRERLKTERNALYAKIHR